MRVEPRVPCLSQAELGLGPNGGLVYCLDYLEQNMDWLRQQLEPLEKGAHRAAPNVNMLTCLFNQAVTQGCCGCWQMRVSKVSLLSA